MAVLPGNEKSLTYLREDGWRVAVVEKWNYHVSPPQRLDLWNFADIIAMKAGWPVLLVQTTTKGQVAPHIRKIRGIPDAAYWLHCGGLLQVHGWYKAAKPGTLREVWQVDVVTILPSLFPKGFTQ